MIPGDLDTLTGGYGYDRRIIGGLRQLGWQVEVVALDGSFPTPTPFAREDARRRFAGIADRSVVLVDGLAFGVLSEEAEAERRRLRLIALVHHPLADETGLDPLTADRFEISERRALAATRLVVVTSTRTAGALARFEVPPSRIVVVEPGTDRGSLTRGSTDGTVRLLCVASLIPRKGHEILIEALARLRDKPWRLTCVGSTERDARTTARVRALIAQYDLVERVRFTGDLHQPDLDREYDAADLFVLPTFHEGYGMVVSEALARGLPVVSCPTGAIADLVTADAGILVPAGHIADLVAALRELIDLPDARARLAAGARRVRDRLPTWEQSARRMSDALDRAAAS
jgi:glycosyltransferase involved in cell wall biosynthesis